MEETLGRILDNYLDAKGIHKDIRQTKIIGDFCHRGDLKRVVSNTKQIDTKITFLKGFHPYTRRGTEWLVKKKLYEDQMFLVRGGTEIIFRFSETHLNCGKNGTRSIDLLAEDKNGNCWVVEVKRLEDRADLVAGLLETSMYVSLLQGNLEKIKNQFPRVKKVIGLFLYAKASRGKHQELYETRANRADTLSGRLKSGGIHIRRQPLSSHFLDEIGGKGNWK